MEFAGSVAFLTSPFQVARLKKHISDLAYSSELLVIASRPRRNAEFCVLLRAIEGLQPALVIWIRRRIPSVQVSGFRRPGSLRFLIRFGAALTFRDFAFAGKRFDPFTGFDIDKFYLGFPFGRVAETIIEKLPTAKETVLLDDGSLTFELIDALTMKAPYRGGDAARQHLLRRSPHLITVFRPLLSNACTGMRVSHQVLPKISVSVEPNRLWIVGTKASTALTGGFSSLKSVWEVARTVGKLQKKAQQKGKVVQYFPHRGESMIGLMLLAARGIKIVKITSTLEQHIAATRKSPEELCGFPSTFFLMADLLLPPKVQLTVLKPLSWNDDFYETLQSVLPSRLTFLEVSV